MKKLALILGSALITSCAGVIENPYNNYNSSQINAVSTPDLCSIARNNMYKSSDVVSQEVKRRGLLSCSANEVHCVGLGAAPGTPAYVSCVVEQEKMDLQAAEEEKRLKQARELADEIAKSNRQRQIEDAARKGQHCHTDFTAPGKLSCS